LIVENRYRSVMLVTEVTVLVLKLKESFSLKIEAERHQMCCVVIGVILDYCGFSYDSEWVLPTLVLFAHIGYVLFHWSDQVRPVWPANGLSFSICD